MFKKLFIFHLLLATVFSIEFIHTKVEKLTKDKRGNIQMGWAKLLVANNAVVFPATYIATVDEELLELEVLIANEWGRIHESLFTTKVSPLNLSFMLILAGIVKGDLVEIKFWVNNKNYFIEDLLIDKRTNTTKRKKGWNFIADEKYLKETNIAGNIAILYSITKATIIDCNDKQSKEDWIFSPNNNTFLKKNQKVMISILKKEKN